VDGADCVIGPGILAAFGGGASVSGVRCTLVDPEKPAYGNRGCCGCDCGISDTAEGFVFEPGAPDVLDEIGSLGWLWPDQ
jgi:hypothetical protein